MAHYTTPDTANHAQSCTFEQKWGDDPFTELGHTQAPNALIEYGGRVKLTPEECWLLTCILKFKHTAADPYPSQDRLAALICQSTDTVRRLLKRIESKGLILIQRVRGEMGHYTHSVYDFRPLRAALNECYYQDHPEERPATVQNCKVAEPPPPHRKTGPDYPAKVAAASVQNCGPNKTLKRTEKEKEKRVAASPPAPAARPVVSSSQEEEERKEPVVVNLPEKPTPQDLRREIGRCGLQAVTDRVYEGWREASREGTCLGLRGIEWNGLRTWLQTWGHRI